MNLIQDLVYDGETPPPGSLSPDDYVAAGQLIQDWEEEIERVRRSYQRAGARVPPVIFFKRNSPDKASRDGLRARLPAEQIAKWWDLLSAGEQTYWIDCAERELEEEREHRAVTWNAMQERYRREHPGSGGGVSLPPPFQK